MKNVALDEWVNQAVAVHLLMNRERWYGPSYFIFLEMRTPRDLLQPAVLLVFCETFNELFSHKLREDTPKKIGRQQFKIGFIEVDET